MLRDIIQAYESKLAPSHDPSHVAKTLVTQTTDFIIAHKTGIPVVHPLSKLMASISHILVTNHVSIDTVLTILAQRNKSADTETLTETLLERLCALISDRLKQQDPASYSVSLATGNPDRVLQKIGEESIEVMIAAHNQSPDDLCELYNELADLLFHMLVYMQLNHINLSDVLSCLRDPVCES